MKNPSFVRFFRKCISGVVCASLCSAFLSSTASAQDEVQVNTAAARKMVITATGVPPAVPVFYTTDVMNTVHVDATKIVQNVAINIDVVQGEPEVLSLELFGPTDGVSVLGNQIEAWALRHEGNKKFLDLAVKEKARIKLQLKREVDREENEFGILTFGAAKATGFQHKIEVTWRKGAKVQLVKAEGCSPIDVGDIQKLAMLTKGNNAVRLNYSQVGSAFESVVLEGLAMEASVDAANESAVLRLFGSAVVTEADAELPLLEGSMALLRFPSNQGYSLRVQGAPSEGKNTRYGIYFDKAGRYPIDLSFSVALDQLEGWTDFSFKLPTASAVPITVKDVPSGSRTAVGRVEQEDALLGNTVSTYLPASGQFSLRWKPQREEGSSKLFYSSQALSEVSVGAGMLHFETRLDFQVLQGKMSEIELKLEGPGDIVDLTGAQVASWSVSDLEGQRVLKIILNGERKDLDSITIRSQYPLGSFPVKVEPMQITPVGAMRHAGYVRLTNNGAVKLGVTKTEGMMQLSPKQYPGGELARSGTQVFVYRFPSAERSWEISADQILPEVSVNEMLVYSLSETDRELRADIELDIREAPLREWEMRIPAEYAVANLTTAEFGQMVVGRTVQNGTRSLTVSFKKEVIGRQLIQIRLARNAATEEGDWSLLKIEHPHAKTIRGNLGVEAALGWRVVTGETDHLNEMPLAYFPQKSSQLQQAYRIRDAKWQAKMKVEALEQSVSADVFHLYSLKEGMLYGSVLVNYFVIGAPMHEWVLQVPELGAKGGIGNVIVEGQNVRSWRQDGEKIVVTLHQPAMGGSTLLVSFEQPMNARGGEIELGTIQPLDATSESGFIQVVSPTQVKKEVKLASGLLKLGATELPAEYRLMSSAPSLAAWQYAARGFELSMDVEWYTPSDTVDQVVDFAELKTQVSRDGEVVTEAQFFVKTRGRRALEMQLPVGSKLLEVSADGQILNARMDGEKFLLPLPAKADPNAPVEVRLRYGGASENPRHLSVGVPVLSAPIVVGEWTVQADTGYLLDVVGGNVSAVEPNLTESGFEWVLQHQWSLWLIVVLTVLGILLGKRRGWISVLAVLFVGIALLMSFVTVVRAYEERRVNQQSFEVVAPVISPEKEIVLELSNLPKNQALRSTPWTITSGLGVLLVIASFLVEKLKKPTVRAAALSLIALGVLGQLGGAVGFFSLLVLLNGAVALRILIRWVKGRKKKSPSASVVGAATSALLLLFSTMPHLNASTVADSIEQTWEISDEHLKAEATIYWKAKAGESIALLQSPASLTSINITGAKLNKYTEKGITYWQLVAEESGVVRGDMRYEMSMKGVADRKWQLPTGDSLARTLKVSFDKNGWEVSSDQAVETKKLDDVDATKSGAAMVFIPNRTVMLQFKPQGRDPKQEELRFSVESTDIYIPAPGVVNAWHSLRLRPISGEMSEFEAKVPKGMMIGEVSGRAVEDWYFDPEKETLRVHLTKPHTDSINILIKSQRGIESLPQGLDLEPVRVEGASSVVGVFGLAFGNDAQPDAVTTEGMAIANLSDFHKGLFQSVQRDLGKDIVLNKVYRYGTQEASLALQVNPVAPELRAELKQVLSIAEERLLLSVDAEVEILRAGVFELQFTMPEGLEVESVSGAAMRDWTQRDGHLVIQLNGKTQGMQKFHLSYTANSPVADGDQSDWLVPQINLVDAMRQIGELLVVPEQGIQVRIVQRQHVTQRDARQSGSHRKGDLAFKLLQSDWMLSLGIEKLDPWVRANLLQEISLREGQTRNRLSFLYEVENAAVKALQLQLPSLSEAEMLTVRASGAAVKEMVHLEDNKWEVRLRRGMIGKIPFEVEFQQNVEHRNGDEMIYPLLLEGVRQSKHYVAIRTSGRLDMRASAAVGWRDSDWSAVPQRLKNKADSSVPALCYVVSEPENTLRVKVQRHEVADTLKLRALSGKLTTVFGVDGASVTLSELNVRVVEKGSMRAILPDGAELFSVTVNGESVDIVSEGNAHLFYVTEGTEDGEHATVNILYRTKGSEKKLRSIELVGPQLSTPLEKVDWFVSLPEGYQLVGRAGGFDLVESGYGKKSYDMLDYRSKINVKRTEQAEQARVQLDQANSWIATGDYKKAEKVLSQVSKNRAVDAASNEDARVQLRNLRNQQAIMGLNTRRQKLYLENKAQGNAFTQNAAFEEAANNNPLFQGKDNYHPAQVEQMLMGNSKEERDAMQKIADRMVSQQLAAQPATQTIEVDIPETETVLHFRRESQLSANTPMLLELKIENPSSFGWAGITKLFALLFVLSLATVLFFRRA
ncbi:hypothetical protein [Rubritalea sp.]|uniref:hypothetical protein n=1 Tax=Rubritalea sp. TaxID=2109375 RepID=UPI003EF412B3